MLDGVGGALFEPALNSLRPGGRHMVIVSKGMRRVSFDLTDFYHNKAHLIGVDFARTYGSGDRSDHGCNCGPGLIRRALRPFEVTTWPLADGGGGL